MKLFEAFKQYIVKHPRMTAYKPTSDKYDRKELLAILEKLRSEDVKVSKVEVDKVRDFLWITDFAYRLYKDFYSTVEEILGHLGMKGEDIVEFFIVFLNHEYKAVSDKIKETQRNMPIGTYMIQDMTNPKVELSDGTKVDMKAAMEGATDATSMLCNYMRRHLGDLYWNEGYDPNRFAGAIRYLYQVADMMATFKHSYDSVLYEKSFVKVDPQAETIAFDDDDYHEEKLKALGQLILGERILHVRCQNTEKSKKSELERYVKFYRVKRMKVTDGYIKLEFGQGMSKIHLDYMWGMQAAIDAYYELLDINMKLEGLGGICLIEVLGVWVALQTLCHEMVELWRVTPRMAYTKEDFCDSPRCIEIADLEAYLVKLTGIKNSHVKHVLKALEVDWTKYNYIWTSPLFRVGNHYCLPFIPIICGQPYNIIESLMQKGGYDLEKRGKDFEQYVYKQIAEAKHEYKINCIASKKFGSKGKGEEIDLLIELRDIVVLAEAKCIHYSMEPQNYGEAWSRLTHGAEQALRKKAYVENHPEVFSELGDVSNKKIVPVVLTNYPTYAGCEHEGVYVIDSHTFISYFVAGYMTKRMMSLTVNPIVNARFFYNSEAGMSANFEKYLKEQPVKQIHIGKMVVEDIPQLTQLSPWKCTAKTVVYKGDPSFDISCRPGTVFNK